MIHLKRGIYGIWLTIVELNGSDTVFISFEDAEQLVKQLPPILAEDRHTEKT